MTKIGECSISRCYAKTSLSHFRLESRKKPQTYLDVAAFTARHSELTRLQMKGRAETYWSCTRCDNGNAMKLWDFATEFYVISDVASACLSLQDEHGVDVNQLIFAAWVGFDRGVLMRPENFRTAADHVHEWRMQVVRPLRKVRRQMKEYSLVSFHPESADLREKVKGLELRAEKLQLESLEAIANTMFKQPAATGTTATALENMRTLLLIQASPRIAADSPALTVLARALDCLRL